MFSYRLRNSMQNDIVEFDSVKADLICVVECVIGK